MSGNKQSSASLLLAFAALATTLPAYAFVRWLWAWQLSHADFRGAVTAFETGFPFGLHGATITRTCVACAVAGVVIAGLVAPRAQGATRAVAYTIISIAATLALWNVWTMM